MTPITETGKRNNEIRTRGLFARGPDQVAELIGTVGIEALGQDAVNDLIRQLMAFEDFEEGNDPYGDRDFGKLEYDGKTVIFRIELHEDPDFERRIFLMLPEDL
ncbi:DUF3768 domain-containing protein [Salipiger mucosus]|uniref:Uncharacterized protein n=1 Tax=Salipiger mucosus DSM 16094 TaxID=1123237 RepID=S9Q9V8_9RHOB|nr:DUF3768 domain-containing protein [Salipiger mucosus]EPX76797.1 hypothetical protein Salmuc_04683 [Salipiger mucosus DSM 16094]